MPDSTHLINFIAIEVPHGKLLRMGFSKTFPNSRSFADIGSRCLPDITDSRSEKAIHDGGGKPRLAFHHQRISTPLPPRLAEIQIFFPSVLEAVVIFDPHRDFSFEMLVLDLVRGGAVDQGRLGRGVGGSRFREEELEQDGHV
jgi:hypothetical protein